MEKGRLIDVYVEYICHTNIICKVLTLYHMTSCFIYSV